MGSITNAQTKNKQSTKQTSLPFAFYLFLTRSQPKCLHSGTISWHENMKLKGLLELARKFTSRPISEGGPGSRDVSLQDVGHHRLLPPLHGHGAASLESEVVVWLTKETPVVASTKRVKARPTEHTLPCYHSSYYSIPFLAIFNTIQSYIHELRVRMRGVLGLVSLVVSRPSLHSEATTTISKPSPPAS